MFYSYGYNEGATVEYFQWSTNVQLEEPSLKVGDKVIFLNSSGMTHPMKAYAYEDKIVVDVPNILFTVAVPFVVYIEGRYETRTRFKVNARDNKPGDYVYVDNDDWTSDTNNALEIFYMETYGIDIVDVLLSGETEMEGDYSALIADVTKAFLAKKMPVLYPHHYVDSYVPVSIYPDNEIAFSMYGDMGTGMLRVDVVLTNNTIYAYMNPLG